MSLDDMIDLGKMCGRELSEAEAARLREVGSRLNLREDDALSGRCWPPWNINASTMRLCRKNRRSVQNHHDGMHGRCRRKAKPPPHKPSSPTAW